MRIKAFLFIKRYEWTSRSPFAGKAPDFFPLFSVARRKAVSPQNLTHFPLKRKNNFHLFCILQNR